MHANIAKQVIDPWPAHAQRIEPTITASGTARDGALPQSRRWAGAGAPPPVPLVHPAHRSPHRPPSGRMGAGLAVDAAVVACWSGSPGKTASAPHPENRLLLVLALACPAAFLLQGRGDLLVPHGLLALAALAVLFAGFAAGICGGGDGSSCWRPRSSGSGRRAPSSSRSCSCRRGRLRPRRAPTPNPGPARRPPAAHSPWDPASRWPGSA